MELEVYGIYMSRIRTYILEQDCIHVDGLSWIGFIRVDCYRILAITFIGDGLSYNKSYGADLSYIYSNALNQFLKRYYKTHHYIL